MKVKCIEECAGLTVGKSYKVYCRTDVVTTIINDDGCKQSYINEYFEPEKVICIRNNFNGDSLTTGKEYEVINVSDNLITVYNNFGSVNAFAKDMFEAVEEYSKNDDIQRKVMKKTIEELNKKETLVNCRCVLNGTNTSKTVSHPNYYNKGIETLKYIKSWDMDFVKGNVIKYVTRAGLKNNEIEDLEKAKFYLEELIKDAKERKN